MRTVLLLSSFCLLAVFAVTTAHAEEAMPVGLADRDVSTHDRSWVPVGDGDYARVACPPLRDAPRKNWHFLIEAYGWAPSISATQYVEGVPSDIDIKFEDLFDRLNSTFMGYAEVRYKRWSFAVDAFYVDLEQTNTDPVQGVAQLDLDMQQTILDLRLGYNVLCREVGKAQWGSCCHPRMLTLDAVVGARYWDNDPTATLSLASAGTRSVSASDSWWDPYIGARFRWQFAKRWNLGVYGDIGGFGIEDASELTWQIQAGIRFYITRGFFLGAGYRALGVDRVQGSGASKTGIDGTYHGPILGLGFSF